MSLGLDNETLASAIAYPALQDNEIHMDSIVFKQFIRLATVALEEAGIVPFSVTGRAKHRQLMEWQKEVVGQNETKSDQPAKDLFADKIYVFTPAGDIIDLPKGATPLDFAYTIHSEVGHRCRGAKVDGNIVPLVYELQTGQHEKFNRMIEVSWNPPHQRAKRR